MSLPEVFYHGTSTSYLQSMLKKGLVPIEQAVTGDEVVYLTTALEVAKSRAQVMCEVDDPLPDGSDPEPIYFTIPARRLDRKAFAIDKNTLRLGPSEGSPVERLPDLAKIGWRRWTWRRLLETVGTVCYKQPIPVTMADITRIEEAAQ